jgi:hypothetical protein
VQDIRDIKGETWRLIVLHSNARELLVLESGRGLSLPCLDIPKGSRIARELSERVRSIWKLDTFCLREVVPSPPSAGSCVPRWFVLETIRPNADTPESGHWLDCSEIAIHKLANSEDKNAVETWRRQASEVHSNCARQRIGDPGSFARIRAWVQQALAHSGVKLGREFRQINAAKDFSLVRFATDRTAVWFKAVGEPNAREFSLTVTLADLFPQFTPAILATEPLWNAWLAPEIPGCRLSQRPDLTAWSRAAHDLAVLQLASVGRTDTILRCNARDLRHSTLVDLIAPFFARLSEFMTRQTTCRPAPLSRAELAELEGDVRRALTDLAAEGLPDTLGHLDLNPDNLIALPERTVFLDWAEASVGHPFFSLAYLLEHFRSHFHGNECEQLVRKYAALWQAHRRFENVERTICLATLVAVFAHAVSTDAWHEGAVPATPRVEGYYRSLARRMKSHSAKIRHRLETVADLGN